MNSLEEYIKSVLQYSLFNQPDQNSEYTIEINDSGILFIPIYPITFEINEKFYSKIFNILNLALIPQYTLVRPLTMQVVNFPDRDITQSRALLFPMRRGSTKRIICNFEELLQRYYQSGSIPIMENLEWDYNKAPGAIITGVVGSGKSFMLKTLYRICENIGEVVAIDPKGSDLARLARNNGESDVLIPAFLDEGQDGQGMGGKYLQQVIAKLKQIEQEMYQRQHTLYMQSSKISTDYREIRLKPKFIFIDELAALLTNSTKKVVDDFKNVLTRLTVLGREAGIYLILAMQSARAEYLPTLVRDSLSLRIQLGRINSENTRFLFPELDEMPMIPLGGKGTGIISIAGDEHYAGIEPLATPTILD
ncbi:type IV secretory system conjugative DNA transfer family protein [Limosilactobacillus reuteri]|jgi:ABC-type glutathione transport system ATPase component|uniref:type IV secretory system conjugative DNA transfer family protein n=1 Tax=Limosilactobacillus reuteri TaxID=1598 RepID=UPI002B05708C|nr:hypothetical protein [Limosilactobacillus reuteri]